MKIQSLQEKWKALFWVKENIRIGNEFYVVCEKKFFTRKIVGTNIRVKPNTIIEDYTVMRYGIRTDYFLEHIKAYKYESDIYAFINYDQIRKFLKVDDHIWYNISKMKKNKVPYAIIIKAIFSNITHLFHHFEIYQAEIDNFQKVIAGCNYNEIRIILTKKIKICQRV